MVAVPSKGVLTLNSKLSTKNSHPNNPLIITILHHITQNFPIFYPPISSLLYTFEVAFV